MFMDKGKHSSLLQTVSIIVAALTVGSTVAFFARAFSEGYHPAYLAVSVILSCTTAILVALPLRLYGIRAVRTLGAVCAVSLVAVAVFGGLVLARGQLWGVPTDAPWLTVTLVAILSVFCSAIILIMKSRRGEKEVGPKLTRHDAADVWRELKTEAGETLAAMRSRRRLPGLLLALVLVVSLGVGVWLDQNGPQWPRAIEMTKILPAENVSLVSYLDFSGRLGTAFRDQWSEDNPSGELRGQDVATMQGLGSCVFASYDENATGESESLVLYEGDFDRVSMARALEGDDAFGPASRHGGVLVWTRTQGQASISIALIDDFIVSGTSERVQQCVEAAQGKRESLFDNRDARDVLNRLPKDLGFYLGVGPQMGEDEPGRLAAASTFLPVAGDFTSTTVEKFVDVDSATARVAELEAERARQSYPTHSKTSQDGVFVTTTGVMNFD